MQSLGPKESFVGKGLRYSRADKKRKWTGAIVITIAFLTILGIASAVIYASPNNGNRGVENYRATANHVVINEVYYDAPSGYDEPQCEWIEIYNPTSQDVDISGWRLTDDPSFDASGEGYWEFPSATTISAGQYILVVNDATYKGEFSNLFPGVTPDFDTNTSNSISDVSKGGSLNLANSGDDVHLFDSSQNEVDAMWYGNGGDVGSTNAAPDVSAGHSLSRYYNAEDTDNPANDFYDESSPTPNAQNSQTIPELNIFIPIFVVLIVGVILRRKLF